MTTTIETLVPQRLWQAVEPLLPTPPPRYGGLPRIDDRAALAGIIYQLCTGIPWRLLPVRELGCGSPVTSWRRCVTGNAPVSGSSCTTYCWTNSAARASSNCWSTAAASRWPLACGPPTPTTRCCWKRWSTPCPRSRAARSACRPRRRPAKLHGDKGYDHRRCRRALRRRGITPRIARRGVESSGRLGRHRYVVERSLAWLMGYRRLQVRYERRADILLGVGHLAGTLICLKALNRTQGCNVLL